MSNINKRMNLIWRSALLGGIILGLLSSIPIISAFNLVFFMWVIIGGIASIFFYKRFTTEKLSVGKGALIGFLSGIIGAFVATILGVIFMMSFNTINELTKIFISTNNLAVSTLLNSGITFFSFFILLFMQMIIFSIFATIGGIIGVWVFGKQNLKDEYNYDTDYVSKLKKENKLRK